MTWTELSLSFFFFLGGGASTSVGGGVGGGGGYGFFGEIGGSAPHGFSSVIRSQHICLLSHYRKIICRVALYRTRTVQKEVE